jgi:uncharacterized small protein (DUF1192 family)
VKIIPKNLNMIVDKSKVALEIWLADLRRTIGVADMGPAFLALQITELENRCAALRKQAKQKASPEPVKKRALRSAA